MADDPEPYRLSDDPPPKRRYRPMPGAEASNEPPPEEPVLKRFIGHDPFPWALGLCVLVWVGLGLGSRSYHPLAWVLIGAGIVVMVLSEIWLYISIFEENRASGVFAFLSSWYRFIYLHMNPEIGFRPTVLFLVGLLMCFTGMGLSLTGRP
jgi:hypothetical protein